MWILPVAAAVVNDIKNEPVFAASARFAYFGFVMIMIKDLPA